MSKPQFGDYGEPWRVEGGWTTDHYGHCVPNTDEQQARQIACVNACAGLNDDQLTRVRAVNEMYRACKDAAWLYDQMALGPLEAAAKYGPDYEPPSDDDYLEIRGNLEKAIAKATGGNYE